jgi:acyl-CoA reductase-like NAD-dependent aldehyde dehydrogenase
MTTGGSAAARQQSPRAYDDFERMCVNGRWTHGRSGDVGVDRDPFSGSVLVRIPLADQKDLDDAFEAAARAQPDWARTLPAERAAVLRRAAAIMEARRGEIVEWLIRESGSTRIKSGFEWELTHAMTLEAASFPSRMEGETMTSTNIPGKESRVYRQPVGVVGMVSPWNFPLHLTNRSVAPALALGNASVIKPASDTPVTGGLLLAKIYEEAGLPAGVLNVLIAKGSVIGDAFVQHPVPRVISFTGSTAVGRRIAELASRSPVLKRVVLELGGNSPCVVLDDADLDLAVRGAVFGKFLHQGQICMAINRLIVDSSIYDDFVDRFKARVNGLRCGDPSLPETVVGPIINEQQLQGLLERIERARTEGARPIVEGDPDGLVLPPHVFVDVANDMSIAAEEVFGPVISIIKVKDEREALRVANDTSYGLSAAVFTRDVERGNRFAQRIQAGMTHINDSPVNDLPNCPFGGEKNSGLGRYNGHWSIEEFTSVHWVSVQHVPVSYPF